MIFNIFELQLHFADGLSTIVESTSTSKLCEYRWKSRLKMLDMKIIYRKHGNADGVSRMAANDEMNDEDVDKLLQMPKNTSALLEET